jgi:5'-methylthioadenosine nucleosidase
MVAMEAEAKPFVEHLGLEETKGFFPEHVPFVAYSGEHHLTKVTVVTLGKDTVYGTGVDNVGTVAASLATELALAKYGGSVDLVVNAGTCGGFQRKGAGVADVFLTTGVANHDRRIPIPGFDTYGTGKLETLDPTKMARSLGYKTGICTTGNALDKTERDDELMKENDASVKDMEAGAIAWVSAMNEVPYLGVKVVTDIVDGGIPTQNEFMENLGAAAKSLQTALPKVLAYVCDESNHDNAKADL